MYIILGHMLIYIDIYNYKYIMDSCMTILSCCFFLDDQAICCRRYSYILVTFASSSYHFDPSVDSHAFEVEILEFIICTPGPNSRANHSKQQ